MIQSMASLNIIIENYKWRRSTKGEITSTAHDMEKELESHGTKVQGMGSNMVIERDFNSRDQGHSKKSTNVSFQNLILPKHSFVLATAFHLTTSGNLYA